MNTVMYGIPVSLIFLVAWLVARWMHASSAWRLFWLVAAIVSLVGTAVFAALLGVAVETAASGLGLLFEAGRKVLGILIQAMRSAG